MKRFALSKERQTELEREALYEGFDFSLFVSSSPTAERTSKGCSCTTNTLFSSHSSHYVSYM